MKKEELISYIKETLKNKNYEPLSSNYLIKYNIIMHEIMPNFQKFLILKHNENYSAEDLLINTDKALIAQLRIFDALFTGKIVYNNNYEKGALFRIFSKDNCIKNDLKVNFDYINQNIIKNSEEYLLIKENLSLLEKNIDIVEKFLKKADQIPSSQLSEFPVYINNIDFFINENLNKESITPLSKLEIDIMESYLSDFTDNIF